MVCMIADYIKSGVNYHEEFIAMSNDEKTAVKFVAELLRQRGCKVVCIAVYPKAHSMEELHRLADEKATHEDVGNWYIFDADAIRPAGR